MLDFQKFDLSFEIEKIKLLDTRYQVSNRYSIYFYSADKILKQMYDISNEMPTNFYVFHSISPKDYAYKGYVHRCPVLVTRKSQENYLLKIGVKKAYTVGSLFTHYRRLNNICADSKAEGTLAFPSHSIPWADVIFDWSEYADLLMKLPSEYQPVSVSLYWKDLLEGCHVPFLERGIKVYTSGHMFDVDFVDNFYETICHFRYTTGNIISSPAFYSVEMNIPYFFYGNKATYYQRIGDASRKKGVVAHESLGMEEFDKNFPVFGQDEINITSGLYDFVLNMSGIGQESEREEVVKLFLENRENKAKKLFYMLGREVKEMIRGK